MRPRPPCFQLVLDRLHPILPFALVRRRGFHSRVRVFEGMGQAEDEGHFLSGKGLFAGVADPGRPVGQYHQFLGCEQVVLKPDLPQASAEL